MLSHSSLSPLFSRAPFAKNSLPASELLLKRPSVTKRCVTIKQSPTLCISQHKLRCDTGRPIMYPVKTACGGTKCLFVGDIMLQREETCWYSDIVTSVIRALRNKTRKLTRTPVAPRGNPKGGGGGLRPSRNLSSLFSSTFFNPGPCLHTPGTESVSGVGGPG